MILAWAHPAAMKELLVAGTAQPLTRVRFRQLYDINSGQTVGQTADSKKKTQSSLG